MSRFRMESKAKKTARQQWLAEFERLVIEARPDLSGRFDWNTPNHLFNTGHSAADAAARFLDSPQTTMPRPINPQVKESS